MCDYPGMGGSRQALQRHGQESLTLYEPVRTLNLWDSWHCATKATLELGFCLRTAGGVNTKELAETI